MNNIDEEQYQRAVEFLSVIKELPFTYPSASLFSRRFRIGYITAARIVERLEKEGYISEFVGGKPRQVLKTKSEGKTMKKFEVEVSITKTFTTKVIVEGEFNGKNDPGIDKVAKYAADNMNHEHWDYNDTEFEINGVKELPANLSSDHIDLLRCGYSLDVIKDYSEEDARAELDAIASSL
ncbi:DNA translocase FtsK [Pseudobacillus sp. 179-B 2D1 NHS]|uniref:DNA translocase FtsK n=1 Tax=Pseudobacillus sp. 179-B 2D1 NHS TaxID=3374292 RepID=UPI0038791A00